MNLSTHGPTAWRPALLSLLPFVLLGPLNLALGYQAGWVALLKQWGDGYTLGFGALMFLIGLGGLALAAAGMRSQRGAGEWPDFPRWCYPYALLVVISAATALNYAAKGTSLYNQPLLWLAVVVALVALLAWKWSPARAFVKTIRQDWTHLSYSLFAMVIFISASVDHEEVTSLTLLVLAPSFIALAGALLHLRANTTLTRILALVGSLTLALVVWSMPYAVALLSSAEARGQFINLMVPLYAILLLLLLAPALIQKRG
jgi:hypothetical protein